MAQGRTHLRSLTSLRFFAAMGVVLFHAGIWSNRESEGQACWGLFRLGFVGVTFFFVLSGFVLVWSATERDTAPAFYRRRFARVYPLHALTWAVALGLASIGVTEVDARSGALNLGLLHSWSTERDVILSLNIVSWSLSDEAFFYALFPFLYLAARRLSPGLIIAGAIGYLFLGGVVAGRLEAEWVYTFPAYRVGEFIVGMALALLVRQGVRFYVPRGTAVAAIVFTYAGLLVLDIQTGMVVARGWLSGLGFLPAILLVLVAFAQSDIDGRDGWLSRPLFVRLGQWSFALYMIHVLLFEIAQPVMLTNGWTVPVVVVVAVAVAGALYEWFERPVEERLRGRSRPAVQLESAGTERSAS